jgi:hypothetical protein
VLDAGHEADMKGALVQGADTDRHEHADDVRLRAFPVPAQAHVDGIEIGVRRVTTFAGSRDDLRLKLRLNLPGTSQRPGHGAYMHVKVRRNIG